ncbi:MAG: right-handed parallel beta-helix repeat-containing protein [Victivallaceae bacterium]|nr:right-handed parallel beta-helix repeat-containing protein [Victivallaceae bacterium]
MPTRQFILSILIIIVANSLQADIYVNNQTGKDSNSGKDENQAVKTIAAGIKKLYATKDTKLILAKTSEPYYESLFIVSGGTIDKPLIIEGNGAIINGLREIPAEKWEIKENLYFYPHPRRGALRPYLVINNKTVPRGSDDLKKLKPFSHYWTKEGAYFKPEKGKSVKDYKIFGTLLISGVTITNSHYIICRNLISEYFANDGFNIHGNCQGLLFTNITGRYNGDDGFSAHDNVSAVVRKGYFHNNDFGIQDVHASQTDFFGVVAENNRRIGINFSGGIHSVTNSIVRNNKEGQIKVKGGNAPHIGFKKQDIIMTGITLLKDVAVAGENYGIFTDAGSKTTVINCIIKDTQVGIRCNRNSSIALFGVIIGKCSKAVIDNENSNIKIDFSILAPGNYIFNEKNYFVANIKDWSKNCSMGKNIIIKNPALLRGKHIFKQGRAKITAGLTIPQVKF